MNENRIKSYVEETIGCLWFMLCLMLADRGHTKLKYIALLFGIISTLASIIFAILHKIEKERAKDE